jgi:hypothetical protein
VGLPADLVAFYAENEGVGLESPPDRLVRLCRLDEIRRIGWSDLHILGADQCPGWEHFAAYRIGMSSCFDEIVYVLDAPSCPAGSILALGVDLSGPGGSGPTALEPSVVLAPCFAEWLRHMEACGWVEYGLIAGELANLPAKQQRRQFQYYQALNPDIDWCDIPRAMFPAGLVGRIWWWVLDVWRWMVGVDRMPKH